jgi:hypothetical protein
MLDGKRYFAEFPDESPSSPDEHARIRASLARLAALERELHRFLRDQLETGGRPR